MDEKFVGAGTVNAERALFASGALQARILAPETNSGGADSITVVGTAGGYKFHSWQLSYGESTVPVEFTPFTQSSSTQKIGETLAVWDTTTVPEGIYTVRFNSNSHGWATSARPSRVECRPDTPSNYLPYRNGHTLRRATPYDFYMGNR